MIKIDIMTGRRREERNTEKGKIIQRRGERNTAVRKRNTEREEKVLLHLWKKVERVIWEKREREKTERWMRREAPALECLSRNVNLEKKGRKMRRSKHRKHLRP